MQFRFIFICVYTCVSVCEYVHCMHIGAYRGQKKVQDPLELKLQITVSCPTRFLGTRARSFARALSTLNL